MALESPIRCKGDQIYLLLFNTLKFETLLQIIQRKIKKNVIFFTLEQYVGRIQTVELGVCPVSPMDVQELSGEKYL